MAETQHDPEAIRAYQRTLAEVAENQVVDAAEDEVTRAWIAELEDMRRAGLQVAAAIRLAERAVQQTLYSAQTSGRPVDLARAHARFAQLEAEKESSLEQAQSLLDFVDAEIQDVCRAGLDRARRSRQDLRRLHEAWTAAYGRNEAD